MVDLRWDGDDFRNSQDSSGSTADLVSYSGKLQQGYQHGILTKGLVAYYPMEKGEGEVLHDGALNNTGQINGASWRESRKIGDKSLKFDGKDDFIQTNSPVIKEPPITLSAWFSADQLASSQGSGHFFASNYADTGGVLIGVFQSDDKFRLAVRDSNGTQHKVTGETIDTNTWHHIVGVVDSNSNLLLYVDGAKTGENTSAKMNTASQDMLIGKHFYDSYHDGKIDDVRIYKRALSQPEIQALYNQGNGVISGTQVTEKQVPGQDQGGVSRYKFNGDVNDSWGSNDGTNNGADLTATGIYGQAARFDGSSDYIDLPNIVDTEPRSISGWFKTKDGSGWIVAQEDNSENFNDDFELRGDSFYTADQKHVEMSLADSNWHFFTITLNGESSALYIDGSIKTRFSVDYSDIDDGNLVLGQKNGSNFFDGKIDDVRIYNTALTPQQVEKLYQKGAYRIPRESTLQ